MDYTLISKYESDKSTNLSGLSVKTPLVISDSKRSEELRHYNLVKKLTISNPGLNVGSSNTSPD
jgi:hypothetical protein